MTLQTSASPRWMPGHLADWTVLVNDCPPIKVSSLMLASNSKHFYDLFKPLDGPPTDRVTRVTCDQPDGLLLMLEQIGCRAATDDVTASDGPGPLGPENLAGLVIAALQFKAPRMLDLALWSARSQMQLDNCWSYWRAAVQTNWEPLRALVQSAIVAIFQPAAALPGFLELTEDELLSFLRHDQLNISSELDVLELTVRWLDGAGGRQTVDTVAHLLGSVRLGWLTSDQGRQFERSQLLERCGQARAAALRQVLSQLEAARTEQETMGTAQAVVAAGMQPARVPHEIIFVCGGWEGLQSEPNFGPSDAVQVFNYHSRHWIRHSQAPGPVLHCGHAYSGCVILGHRIYIVGGYVSHRASYTQGPTSSVKEYDLRRRVWRQRAPMHHQRNYVSAGALDGFVYAVGGHSGRSRLNTAERYNPELNRWQMIAPMQQTRSDAGCIGLLGSLYVCGGFNGHQFFSSVERYDPAADQWTYTAAMLSVRSGVSVCECGGQLYALGGNNGTSRLSTVEKYDPERDQWTTMSPMLTQRSNFSAALLRGEIYAIGGWSDQTNTTVSVVEKWLPGALSVWQKMPNLQLPASANCCCSVVGLDLVESLLIPSDPPQQLERPPQQEEQLRRVDRHILPGHEHQQHPHHWPQLQQRQPGNEAAVTESSSE